MKTSVRPVDEYGKTHQRQRPIHEKESVKWFEGNENLGALKVHCPNSRMVGVSDRDAMSTMCLWQSGPLASIGRCVRHGTAASSPIESSIYGKPRQRRPRCAKLNCRCPLPKRGWRAPHG
jgi:hypothetical protein